MIGTIPSPSSPNLGPFRMYGVMIALGVLAAIGLAQKRWKDKGGDPDQISELALWCIPAGLIGTRIYHVITDYQKLYCGPPRCSGSLWPDALFIWRGGLGIPGGILAGFLVGIWRARRMQMDIPLAFDMAAPCIPLAQAIGRWGNWFNQELFGRPTDLPWGLEITNPSQLRSVPEAYQGATVFHPTFLYESLWSLGICGLLILVDRWKVLRPGKLLPAYLVGYFLGRMWIEELRIDTGGAHLGSFRWNFLLSVGVVIGSMVWLFWGGVRRRPGDRTTVLVPEPVGVVAGVGAVGAADTGSGVIAPGEVATDDIPTDDIPTDDIPTDDIPTDDIPTDDIPPADRAPGDVVLEQGAVAADPSAVERGDDRVAEPGPGVDGPRSELPVAEGDEPEA